MIILVKLLSLTVSFWTYLSSFPGIPDWAVCVLRPHQKQLTVPAQLSSSCPPVCVQRQRGGRRRAPPPALHQQRALRGDAGGGRQDDGRLPRPQRHRALHPVRHEYCKFGPTPPAPRWALLCLQVQGRWTCWTQFVWLCVFSSFLEVRLPNFTVMPV